MKEFNKTRRENSEITEKDQKIYTRNDTKTL